MPDTEPTPWLARLAATALPERPALLEGLVLGEFRKALLMSESDELPHDESYFAHGLTSLGAVEIEQRLEATFGRPISAASLLNNPTVGHLLDHLRTEVLPEFFAAPGAAAEPGSAAEQQGAAGPRSVPKSLVADVLGDLYAS